MLRSPRFWLGLVLAVVLMAVALRGVRWTDLRAELAGAHYGWLLPAAATIVVGQLARAARWRVLFGRGAKPSLAAAWAILSIGYFLSAVLPLRLGDVARAWLVDAYTPADGATALATIVVERVVDLLTILLLMALWVPGPGADFAHAHGAPAWLTAGTLRVGAVACLVAFYVGLAVVSSASGPVESLTARLLRLAKVSEARTAWLAAAVGRFVRGFLPLRHPRTAVLVLAWSLVVWWLGAVGYWITFRAFGLELSMTVAVFATCVAALFAAFLPPAPGYVGAFHAAVREALGVYGVGAAVAASYALVLHGLTMLVLVAMGVAGMWLLGVSPATLRAGTAREPV